MSKIDKDSRLGIQMKNELTNHVEDELIDEHLSVKRNATDISNNPAQGTLDTKPKANKSTFKVTSVILHADESGREHVVSVVDEEDESGLDGSLLQVGEDEQMPQFSAADKRHERVDSSSRFKVVKINKKEPYVRGRWRVLDFMSEADIASTRVVEGSSKKGSESGNSSRASSHHYVHGIDDPSKNPLAAIFPYPSTLPTIQQSNAGVQASDEMLVDDSGSEDANLDQTNALVTEVNTHHVTFGATNYIDEPHDGSSDRLNDNQRNATDGSQHNSIIGFQPPLGLLQAGQHISSANTVLNEATVLSENVAPTQHNTQVVNPPGVPLPILPDVKPLPVLINLQKETFDLRETAKAEECAKPNVYNSVAPLESVLTVLTPSVAMEPENQKQEEPDPTTSVVAIDNKIEQAMDLVKSHLMLAVREEVEELRLQIKQLIERNNQLEQENKILRTSATPETLAQLNLLSRQQHIHSNPK